MMWSGDTGCPTYGAAFQELVHRVLFQVGYEKNTLFAEQSKPGITEIALVKDHNGTFGQIQSINHAAFRGCGPQ